MTKSECREKISNFFVRMRYVTGSTKSAVRRDIKEFFKSMSEKQD